VRRDGGDMAAWFGYGEIFMPIINKKKPKLKRKRLKKSVKRRKKKPKSQKPSINDASADATCEFRDS
jgi:hypothetical protein